MSHRISFLTPALAALVCAAAAAPAGAETFCAPAPCTDGTPKPTIEEAVQAADTQQGPDVVSIKAGSFTLSTGPWKTGLAVGSPDTEIHGAGRDATILTTAALESDFGSSRTLISGHMSRIADLTLRLPSAVTPGRNASINGLDLYDGTVENVKVDAVGAVFGPGANDGQAQGMLVRNGSIRDIVIDLPRDADTEGLTLGHIDTSVDIDGADVTAQWAVRSTPQTDAGEPIATNTATRMRIRGGEGALNVGDGRFELTDSIIETQGDRAAVAVYSGRSPNPATLIMDRVTLLGPGTPGSAAMSNGGYDEGTTTTLRARHVLAAGFGASVELQAEGNLVTAIDHSALPATVRREGSTKDVAFADVRTGDPLLTAPGAPTVRAGSPAIDVGGEPLLGAEPARDLVGAPRRHDGDGDGTATIDAGALEYQGGPPSREPVPGPGFPSPQPPQGPSAPGGSPSTRDVVAPALGALRLSSTRVRPRRSLTVGYTLSEAAMVKLEVQRRTTGRRRGSRCLKAARRGAKPCTLWVTVRSVARRQPAGSRSLVASARTLRRGAHRVVVTATDAAGNRAAARTATFTVVR